MSFLKQLLTLEIFTRFLRAYLDAWFGRNMTQSHLAMLDPEPCPIPLTPSVENRFRRVCGKPGSVLTLIELKTPRGTMRKMGVRKLCLEHSVTVACNKYWMRLAEIKANAEIKKAERANRL
jgi:hypothetical protein